jgi:hypothetical protein
LAISIARRAGEEWNARETGNACLTPTCVRCNNRRVSIAQQSHPA